MKTRELIRLLNNADPSGELECNIRGEGGDAYVVERMPGYWDGPYEVIERDPANPYYNVTGFRFTTRGDKVMIRSLSLEDVLFENPNLPVTVDYTYLDNGLRTTEKMEHIGTLRAMMRKMRADMDRPPDHEENGE